MLVFVKETKFGGKFNLTSSWAKKIRKEYAATLLSNWFCHKTEAELAHALECTSELRSIVMTVRLWNFKDDGS